MYTVIDRYWLKYNRFNVKFDTALRIDNLNEICEDVPEELLDLSSNEFYEHHEMMS